MLASPVPLIVYVAPAGARAGSAGTFIALAAHVAAMAPSTSIGAASPVELGGGDVGGDVDSTMAAKVTNILSADIENLAARRGEAATAWAIAAVQEAAAATAQQALDLGVIDLIATDVDHLVEQLEGRQILLANESTVLHLENVRVVTQEMTPVQRALNLLVDPNLATILLSLGVLGLIVEIRTPGFNVAGILGIICLLLAFYALGQLDANLTGIIFMLLALALFVAEAFTPTFGLLTAGGVVAFLLGGALLFDTPGINTPWPTLIVLAILLGAMTLLVGYFALRGQRRPIVTGSEGLIGAIGTSKGAFAVGEMGSVYVWGEWWNARLTTGAVAANQSVRVVERERMTLIVSPLAPDAASTTTSASRSAPQSTPIAEP
jgi:membrane-bound serine protease (ClpP class)